MSTIPARLAAAVVTAAALAAVAGHAEARSTAGPIMIGISLSLSGDFSDSGKAAERGYKLWAKTVNAKGGVLGRQVQLVIQDDTSSPTQAQTNYQTFITKDKVDLVFGPFSTLLSAPSAVIANRYGYAFIEPAGGGPAVFDEKLHNVFFTQPAPVLQSGDVFAKFILSLPKSERPKTAAYPSLDDPFSSPIADHVRSILSGKGIKTVYKSIYPSETTDMGPVIQKVASTHADAVIGGTQNGDAYAQVKAMVQQKYSPKFVFLTNGPNDPSEFPSKERPGGVPQQGRREERQRDLQHRRLVPAGAVVRQRGVRQGVREGVRRGRDRSDVRGGLRRRPAAAGGGDEDEVDRQQDDHRHAAHGHVEDGGGEPPLELDRRAAGQRPARRVDQREALPRLPRERRAPQARRAEAGVGAVIA